MVVREDCGQAIMLVVGAVDIVGVPHRPRQSPGWRWRGCGWHGVESEFETEVEQETE